MISSLRLSRRSNSATVAECREAYMLAWRLGLSRSHVSRLAKRLEIKGLIHREKSLSDRRALILRLTAAGRAVIPHVAAAADETNARNFYHI